MRASARTRLVGIIGDPVAHSQSPAMHNAAFEALALDYVYVAFQVTAGELAHAFAGVRALGMVGLNITVPHKERALRLVDAVSATAQRVGAVNTVARKDGRLIGDNTDVVGVARALRDAGCRVRGARAVLIGAGGAARAVMVALADGGARKVTIANRTAGRAHRLVRSLAPRTMETAVVPLAALSDSATLADADIIINASALGLHGEAFLPLRYRSTAAHCMFFDLIYGSVTDFLRQARLAGRPTLDGASMLLHQGAAAFTLWTGRRPPIEVMRAALGRRRT